MLMQTEGPTSLAEAQSNYSKAIKTAETFNRFRKWQRASRKKKIEKSQTKSIFSYVYNNTCAVCESGWNLSSEFEETFISVIEFPLVAK